MADYEAISDPEKARIASEFLLHAPPGEFNEVFNDVRILVNNDTLLRENCGETFSQYNKDQMHSVSLEGQEEKCLITQHNNLEGDVFHDPNPQKSFKFDHLKKAVAELKDHTLPSPPLRKVLDEKVRAMVGRQYGKDASCGVFYKATTKGEDGSEAGGPAFVICIENNKFQPANWWNGRWRSEFTLTFPSQGEAVLEGVIKVQIHYYEDGNIQLVSKKNIKTQYINHGLKTPDSEDKSELESLAESVSAKMVSAENEYQKAVTANYDTMSETSFKALRRQLPITRELIRWEKILGYKIGNELQAKDNKA